MFKVGPLHVGRLRACPYAMETIDSIRPINRVSMRARLGRRYGRQHLQAVNDARVYAGHRRTPARMQRSPQLFRQSPFSTGHHPTMRPLWMRIWPASILRRRRSHSFAPFALRAGEMYGLTIRNPSRVKAIPSPPTVRPFGRSPGNRQFAIFTARAPIGGLPVASRPFRVIAS